MKNLILLLFSVLFLTFSAASVVQGLKANKEKSVVSLEQSATAATIVSNEMNLVSLTLTPITYNCEVICTEGSYLIPNVLEGFLAVDDKPPVLMSVKAVTNKPNKKTYVNDFDYSFNKFLKQS